MVFFRMVILVFSAFFAATAHAQNCNQSFIINTSVVVPEAFDTKAFGGMQCGMLEHYRADIYVHNLLDISDTQLADLAKWKTARQTYLTKIQAAE
ncbi:hypothetical protein E4634_16135 [Mangrovimicrobium sediminis]|uniref:DUF1311 domain-containing protein n=1 Tax=Mangrovimicrobium sediminis TaxID=2562682 RepID=A0A4Z0LYM5_9GAMM|nr:hypothetical protein [Haliea sp. SAOS-164]TGD72195.1 hypothetical protein E4634_16135 [Haliea sp. SAOS-164]